MTSTRSPRQHNYDPGTFGNTEKCKELVEHFKSILQIDPNNDRKISHLSKFIQHVSTISKDLKNLKHDSSFEFAYKSLLQQTKSKIPTLKEWCYENLPEYNKQFLLFDCVSGICFDYLYKTHKKYYLNKIEMNKDLPKNMKKTYWQLERNYGDTNE